MIFFRKVLVFFLIVFVCIFFYSLFKEIKNPSLSGRENPALLGKEAKPLSLRWLTRTEKQFELEKEVLSLDLFQGRFLLINFWASWCHSCQSEAVFLSKLWDELQKKQGILLGVAVHDELKEAINLARKLAKPYPLAYDFKGKTSVEYGLTGVPESLLIDPKGHILYWHKGPIDKKVFKELFQLIVSYKIS